MQLPVAFRIWLLLFAACAAAVALSFSRADVPIALYCSRFAPNLGDLGRDLGSALILSAETITVLALVVVRLVGRKIPRYAEILGLACLTSICAYAIDSNVLKLYFGVPNPIDVAGGAKHVFNFWRGSPRSSFPSGHMILAAAFAGVFMQLYRASIWPLSIFLLLAAGLLIVGNWHFLSDVIAGTFLGVSAGLLAGELWEVHSNHGRTSRRLVASGILENIAARHPRERHAGRSQDSRYNEASDVRRVEDDQQKSLDG